MNDYTPAINSGRVADRHRKWYESHGYPEWGNCIRGCPPAYLNKNGFCSPNCERGWPRGEFVTAPRNVTFRRGVW